MSFLWGSKEEKPKPEPEVVEKKTPTDRLFDAVEDGRPELVKKALDDGANADERKKVTLVVKWKTGERVVEEGGLFWSEKREDEFETKVDSQLMESVLAIAVRNGKVDVVDALLDSGRCDPNKKIAWRIADFFTKWNEEVWEKNRWFQWNTLQFTNALEFALFYGKANFNLKGSSVTLNSPKAWEDVRVEFAMVPRLEVVKTLVRHGARVTEAALEAARRLKDGRDAYSEKITPRPEFDEFFRSTGVYGAPAAQEARPAAAGPAAAAAPHADRPAVQVTAAASTLTASQADAARLAAQLEEQRKINEEQMRKLAKLQADYEALTRQQTAGAQAPAPTPAPAPAPALAPAATLTPPPATVVPPPRSQSHSPRPSLGGAN